MTPCLARAGALLAALALGACGARPVPAGPPLPAAERESLDGLVHTLHRLDVDLAPAPAAGGAPDCNRACLLQRHICTLADRICDIASRHPGDPHARERCRDARERCRRAQERVADRCRCL